MDAIRGTGDQDKNLDLIKSGPDRTWFFVDTVLKRTYLRTGKIIGWAPFEDVINDYRPGKKGWIGLSCERHEMYHIIRDYLLEEGLAQEETEQE